jgi:hypothetical protein
MSDDEDATTRFNRVFEQARLMENKRVGAAFVALAIAWIASRSGMAWWEIALICAVTYWGLHGIAGIKISWWG